MTAATIVLRPGRMPLADWRGIFGGAAIELDSVSRVDVEAGYAALAAILAEDGASPPPDSEAGSPSVAELIETKGALLAENHVRLLVALKLASLAQGVSGVRWDVVKALAELLEKDLLPVVPEGTTDRLALSRVFGALSGAGEVLHRGDIRPAADLLRYTEHGPLKLNPRERAALLSGSQPALAATLAGLFTAERILHAAIVALAFAGASAGASALHPSAHRLHRQRGEIDVAATLRAFRPGAKVAMARPAAPPNGHANGRSATLYRLGAALDLLRQAGGVLERAANSVSEDRLVLWQSEEVVTGVTDATALAFATDLIAMSLGVIGDVVAGEIAAARDGEAPATRAAALVAANRERGNVPALDPNAMGRLKPMLAATSEIVAEALLPHAGGETPKDDALAETHRLFSAIAPHAKGGKSGGKRGGIGKLAEQVRSGALTAAAAVELPSVAPIPQRTARRPG